MTKGLAQKQIVLLVLAIIILAVSVYMIYKSFLSGGRFGAENCRSIFKDTCTTCLLQVCDRSIAGDCQPCRLVIMECADLLVREGLAIDSVTGEFEEQECAKVGIYR